MRFSERQQLLLCIGVFCLLLIGEGAFAYFCMKDRREALDTLDRLEADHQAAQTKMQLIPQLKEKSEELARIIDEYVAILPTEAEASSDAFLEDIDRFTRDTGLTIKSAKPVVLKERNLSTRGKKGQNAQKSNFFRHKYRFELEGTFFGLVKFISSIENHSRFLQVDALELSPLSSRDGSSASKESEIQMAENPRKHLMVEISTYTYSKESVPTEVKQP